MLLYALRRLLQFIPTVLVISLIMFFLLNVLPGNAALMAAGVQDRGMDAKYVEQMLKKWDLDKPLHLRYWDYLKNLAQGNMGLSFLRGEDVRQVVEPFLAMAELLDKQVAVRLATRPMNLQIS